MSRQRRNARNARTRPSTGSEPTRKLPLGAQQKRRKERRPASLNKVQVAPSVNLAQEYEIETIIGLEEYARREARRLLGKAVQVERGVTEGRFSLRYDGNIRRFGELKTATAVHRVENFVVPRPRALLGHQHLTRLLGVIHLVLDARPAGAFRTFRITAAGAGSGVYSRLRQEIAAATGLEPTDDAAHLQIAVRRATSHEGGWQVLIRTDPMPLSARRWRVCDMPGALNATVASVMTTLARPRSNERVLNICCGSGTLMIERLGLGGAGSVIGVDIDTGALQCAAANLSAAGHRASVSLLQADSANLPLPEASIDTIAADLPFGMLRYGYDISSLYQAALAESSRVARPNASLVVITTRRRAMLSAIENNPNWNLASDIPLSIPYSRGYIKPHIYLLRARQNLGRSAIISRSKIASSQTLAIHSS